MQVEKITILLFRSQVNFSIIRRIRNTICKYTSRRYIMLHNYFTYCTNSCYMILEPKIYVKQNSSIWTEFKIWGVILQPTITKKLCYL